MKAGDTVKVRRVGSSPSSWGSGEVLVASPNNQSLCLFGEELPSPENGLTLHPKYGKVLALLESETKGVYIELVTASLFEVQP